MQTNTNQNITRRNFITLMGAGLTTLMLGGCSGTKTKLSDISDISLEECFYDDNTDGVDDMFEQVYSNSSDSISEITNIEKYIAFAQKANTLIDDATLKPENKDYLIRATRTSTTALADPDELLKRIDELEKTKESDSTKWPLEKLINYRNEIDALYCQLAATNRYLKRESFNILSNFGINLTKAIVLEAAQLDSPDEIENITIEPQQTAIDIFSLPYYITYSSNSLQVKYKVESNSGIYNVIDSVYNSQIYHKEYNTAQDGQEKNQTNEDYQYNQEVIDQICQIINAYKMGTYLNPKSDIDDVKADITPHDGTLQSESYEETEETLSKTLRK